MFPGQAHRHSRERRLLKPSLGKWLLARLTCRVLDRLHDVVVAGTPAQVTGDSVAYLLLGGVWYLLQKLRCRHNHAGGAETALETVLLPETLLKRVKLTIGCQALYG